MAGTRDWTDRPAVVIGSGPSLAGVALPVLLAGRGPLAVVAVKEAGFAMPGADACLCADHKWTHRVVRRLPDLRPPFFLCVDEDWSGPLPAGATLLRRWPDDPALPVMSPDPGALAFGCTSGFAALNYAVLRGARRVVLLGFDYGHDDEGRHHADPDSHPWYRPAAQKRLWEWWREPFRRAAPELAGAGIDVLNATPGSHLDAFPLADLDDALPRA